MKAQLPTLVFLIVVIIGIVFGFLFFNIFYGISYERKVFRINIIDIFRNVIENFKNYLYLALTYSSHMVLREHALTGSLRPAGSWICNVPTQPKVGEVKECLEKWTNFYLNIYLGDYNTSLPITILHTNFTKCIYGVDEGDVLGGKVDEGYYWVNCTDVILSIFGRGEDINIIFNEKNITDSFFITKNRFWYMYRIFYEWAQDNVYGKCMCSACVSCGDCNAANNCAKLAFEDLKKRFDEYVKCYEPIKRCCQHEYGGPSCEPRSECLVWKDTICKCTGHFCEDPKISSFNMEIAYAQSLSCISYVWIENRLASTHTFTCEDHKYYVPSAKGPVPLTFGVLASAMYRCPDACPTPPVQCDCPEDASDCSQCISPTGCPCT